MRAAIYARVSSPGDRQSTGRQVADLTLYAAAMGLDVAAVFEEHASGARRNGERPVLAEALDYCRENKIGMLLVSELSRLGRNAFEVLETVKRLADDGVNLYMQKERFTLLGDDGRPTMLAPVMLATLSTCAELERENIKFRLNSGRRRYVEQGGKLGRKPGSVKPHEQKAGEYKAVLKELRRGTSVRRTARLCGVSASTVQRLKKEFGL